MYRQIPPHSEGRKAAYRADITYGTNNEFGFDYLRDNMSHKPSEIVQRKFHFTMIDEVDSVLIDDARTPLIISGPTQQDNREELFVKLFDTERNHFLKRQIIVAMTNWKSHYWLVDVKNQFNTLTTWERRAFIYASFHLGDEGSHWRKNSNDLFSKEEKLINKWCADRKQNNKPILV